MNPLQNDTTQASPAPLLAAITREIRERRAALKELEESWLAALMTRDLMLARWITECAAEHRRQLALARAERSSYGRPRIAASL